jgi:hypothetical protein
MSQDSIVAPSPLVGEGYSEVQRGGMGEGDSPRSVTLESPPLPTEYIELLAMPSPTRGEGAITPTVLAAPFQTDASQ